MHHWLRLFEGVAHLNYSVGNFVASETEDDCTQEFAQNFRDVSLLALLCDFGYGVENSSVA